MVRGWGGMVGGVGIGGVGGGDEMGMRWDGHVNMNMNDMGCFRRDGIVCFGYLLLRLLMDVRLSGRVF